MAQVTVVFEIEDEIEGKQASHVIDDFVSKWANAYGYEVKWINDDGLVYVGNSLETY